jgi:hypothetical protein
MKRRERKRLSGLFGKLEWDSSYDYKANGRAMSPCARASACAVERVPAPSADLPTCPISLADLLRGTVPGRVSWPFTPPGS